jgi:hypothetical protein
VTLRSIYIGVVNGSVSDKKTPMTVSKYTMLGLLGQHNNKKDTYYVLSSHTRSQGKCNNVFFSATKTPQTTLV